MTKDIEVCRKCDAGKEIEHMSLQRYLGHYVFDAKLGWCYRNMKTGWKTVISDCQNCPYALEHLMSEDT